MKAVRVPRDPNVVTLARARREYADRTTTAPAVYQPDGKLATHRTRSRAARTTAFRAWARHQYGKRTAETLSPKLARIVHGPQ